MKYTDQDREIWIERYLKGETARNIAKDYPLITEGTISRYIKEQGYSRGKGKQKRIEDLKSIIIKEYLEDKYATFTSLSKKYQISDRTISKIIQSEGIKVKNPVGKISHCNEDYFEQIDTPNKAYLLGFITADGAVTGRKNTTCLSVEVKDNDIDIIYFFQKEINPNATITSCHYDKKTNSRISFNSKKLCNDLQKYGIVQNKSKIIEKVPTELIPKNLLCYYFRGLIDGDGCIHKDGTVSIYSGNRQFIESVQNILVQEINVKKLRIYQGTSYFISWGSKEDKQKLFNYLYSNLEATFYYKRKYERLYKNLYDNTEINI